MDLKPRDLCDVVRAVCNLHLCNPEDKSLEKELRILAKRSGFMLGDMDQRSKEVIRDSFAMIDFYDVDLVQMLKKYKLVKGADKK